MAKKSVKKKAVKKTSKTVAKKRGMKAEKTAGVSDSKVAAFITTFFSIIGFIVALLAWRDDEYVMFYAKQSLILFIIWIFVAIVGSLISIIPIVGGIIAWVLNILVVVGWVMTWIYALSGKKTGVPIVSNFTRKFNL